MTIQESAPVLGKRKDTDPSRSLFAGESKCGPQARKEEDPSDGGKEKSLFEWMERCCEELRERIASGEISEVDGEEEEDDEPCEICKKKGHWHLRCPWKICCGSAFPTDIPPKYNVACKHCHGDKFEEKTRCARCGSCDKVVLLKTCKFCWARGHSDNTDEDCRLFGKELTPENHPLRLKNVHEKPFFGETLMLFEE